ncbi:MAG TPA: hypothetical protein VJ827_12720 [Rubrobacter sp.]|nr:hypothetical protein [Rubrobacter sp.]
MAQVLRETAGERSIRGNGKRGSPAGSGLFLSLIIACAFLFTGCGSDENQAPPPPAPSSSTPAGAGTPTDNVAVGAGQAESTGDLPFNLNTQQPVPPDFQEAYGRRARIVVQFYKLDEDALSYPQGLSVDRHVNVSMEKLSRQYPTIEFFSYDIADPGPVSGDRDLQPGEYGTLAAQLGVGITPFVAMLAPSGDEYVVTNLFQGYVPRPVLSQALFDLAAVEVEDNTSDVNVTLDQVETTDTGGGIEFFIVRNRSAEPVNLQGFTLRVLDPETAQVNPGAPGVTINSDIRVQPGQSVSIGRVPDVVDDEGRRVAGTFEGGTSLDLAPGDQIALLDPGGAVASTITV